MDKESLFKFIRSEEVVLWIGAGMSLYAGYPSGKELGKILYEELTEWEKLQINSDLPLPYLADAILKIKGNNKNSLIRILKKHFDFTPTITTYHDKLATIPHFKTIITTNYDRLIENSYGRNGQLLLASKHIPYLERDKVSIFKVHGDLSNPESIILTNTDYTNFFKNETAANLYWTVIKERLATNNILFLGYNLEDPNISVIFEKITEILGQHRKEYFFVAPGLPMIKVLELNKSGIHYIDSTGQVFIDELLESLKQNITNDFEKGIVSAQTYSQFTLNHNVNSKIEIKKDGSRIIAMEGTHPEILSKFHFSVKDEKDFIEKFNGFLKGNNFGIFEIPKDKIINADISVGGIAYPGMDNVNNISLKSVPSLSTEVDICFDDGLEFSNIPVDAYRSNSLIELRFNLKNALLKVRFKTEFQTGNKIDFKYEHKDLCLKVKEEIELFTLLYKFSSGQPYRIYRRNEPAISATPNKIDSLLQYSIFHLNHFKNLQIIEQEFKLRFQNFDFSSITEDTVDLTSQIVAGIKGDSIAINYAKDYYMSKNGLSEHTLNVLKGINDLNNTSLVFQIPPRNDLYGQLIDLKEFCMEFFNLRIKNIEAIESLDEQEINFTCEKLNIKFSKCIE